MTVSARNLQQKIRQSTVMSVEVLSLYADPICPDLAGQIPAAGGGCWVFMHTTSNSGQNTHRVPWVMRNCHVANSERCLT